MGYTACTPDRYEFSEMPMADIEDVGQIKLCLNHFQLLADGKAEVEFTPDSAVGTVELTYTAQDAEGEETTVTIGIRGRENQVPVAEDSALETYKNLEVQGKLKVADPEGEAMTFAVTRNPRRGTVELGENGNLLIDKGKKGTVTTEVQAEPFTTAPVAKGAKLGKLTIRSGDEILRELPLVAKEQVERVTFGQLFVKILRRVAMAKEVTAQGTSE